MQNMLQAPVMYMQGYSLWHAAWLKSMISYILFPWEYKLLLQCVLYLPVQSHNMSPSVHRMLA